VKHSREEFRKAADTSAFLEQSMELYHRKLKNNYIKALKRTQRSCEVLQLILLAQCVNPHLDVLLVNQNSNRTRDEHRAKWSKDSLNELDAKYRIYTNRATALLKGKERTQKMVSRLRDVGDAICESGRKYLDNSWDLKSMELTHRKEKLSAVDCVSTDKYDEALDRLEDACTTVLAELSRKIFRTVKFAEELTCQYRVIQQYEDDLQELSQRRRSTGTEPSMPFSSEDDPRVKFLCMGSRVRDLCLQTNLSTRECEAILINILHGSSVDEYGETAGYAAVY
jgi:hypothetical protein